MSLSTINLRNRNFENCDRGEMRELFSEDPRAMLPSKSCTRNNYQPKKKRGRNVQSFQPFCLVGSVEPLHSILSYHSDIFC